MLATRMYRALKEERRSQKIKEKRNKTIKLTTLTAIGIGAAVGATMIYKKNKSNQNEDYDEYMYNLESYNNEDENYELEEKIEEFNSNRLSYDNEQHSSNEEMNKFINKID